MKKLVSVVMMGLAVSVLAAPAPAPAPKPAKQTASPELLAKRRAFMQKHYLRKTGGRLIRPGTVRGAIAFVNAAGAKVPADALKSTAAGLSKLVMVTVNCIDVPSLPKKGLLAECRRHGANAAVFFTWDESCDVPMIYAPEQHWAVVNCRMLREGAADDKAYAVRLDREAKRAFSYVCGAGACMGGGGIMGVTRVSELDGADSTLEMDITSRYNEFLKSIGVSPWEETTYLKACQQGWAPAPTNEYQKAIWDKVHELPTAPIKIKPEAKPVKE